MAILSEEARQNKVAYNIKRNNELTTLFRARLSKKEYQELCDYLKLNGMNKAEFVRWAFDKLREGD
jgi:hypothetical protein